MSNATIVAYQRKHLQTMAAMRNVFAEYRVQQARMMPDNVNTLAAMIAALDHTRKNFPEVSSETFRKAFNHVFNAQVVIL
jgi:hypothetical protein